MNIKHVTDKLSYGRYIQPHHAVELFAKGFTDVLNICVPYPDPELYSQHGLKIHQWQVIPDLTIRSEDIAYCMKLMKEIMKNPTSRLYVHCQVGASRSPTIVWLYLAETIGKIEATKLVRPDWHLVPAG